MGSPRENAAGKAGKPGARTQAQARARGQETMIYKPKKSRVRLFFSQLNLSFNPAATALFSGNAANNHTSTRHSAMP